jgi:hypothetical protein
MARHSIIVQIPGPWKTYTEEEYSFPIVKVQDKYSLIIYWYGRPRIINSYTEGYACLIGRKYKEISICRLGHNGYFAEISTFDKIGNIKKLLNRKLTKQLAIITFLLYARM